MSRDNRQPRLPSGHLFGRRKKPVDRQRLLQAAFHERKRLRPAIAPDFAELVMVFFVQWRREHALWKKSIEVNRINIRKNNARSSAEAHNEVLLGDEPNRFSGRGGKMKGGPRFGSIDCRWVCA